MKSVHFSTEANRDIEEIANYLFSLNPLAAYRFLNALDEAAELLAEHSLIGRPRPTLGEGLRSFPVGNYLIFYVPTTDGIYGGPDLPEVFQK